MSDLNKINIENSRQDTVTFLTGENVKSSYFYDN